jgi:uncharacterized protein involved in exopolysaccharide biosynthesis
LELTDVFHRVIRRHLVLIVLAVGLGSVIPLGSHAGDRPRYQATTRVLVETADLRSAEESAAVADSARGIVTSGGVVTAALETARANRDPVKFADRNVRVRSVGASGVLEVVVTDGDPRVAAAVANSLAEQLIESRERLAEGELPELVAELDKQVADVVKTIGDVEAAMAGVDPASAAANSLRLQHDRAVRQRSDLELQRQQLLESRAARPTSSIIDRAEPPTHRLPSGRVPDMILGGLLGLVLGIAAAAVLEVLQPTLVGPEAISKLLAAPVLGRLSCPPEKVPTSAQHVIPPAVYREIRETTDHLNLAAAAAGVNVIRLESAGPAIDLERLGNWLGVGSLPLLGVAPSQNGRAVSNAVEPAMDVDPFLVGVVLVTPTTMKRGDLDPLRHLLAMTHWPLLGIVAYRRGRLVPVRLGSLTREPVSVRPDSTSPTAVSAP